MLRNALLFFAVACGACCAVAAGLPVGPLFLTLGSDQESVINQIKPHFHLVPVSGSPGMFFLSEGKRPKGNVIGGVAFKNSRLNWIQRNWGVFNGRVESTEVSKAIHLALESASVAGQDASVSVTNHRVPNAEFKVMNFSFSSGRKVVVTITESSAPPERQVSIDESISEQ